MRDGRSLPPLPALLQPWFAGVQVWDYMTGKLKKDLPYQVPICRLQRPGMGLLVDVAAQLHIAASAA